jgi:hypothetical protein
MQVGGPEIDQGVKSAVIYWSLSMPFNLASGVFNQNRQQQGDKPPPLLSSKQDQF